MASEGKTNKAWSEILKEHPDIFDKIKQNGSYEITAKEIKRFREPRLMTKHDTSASVPAPLKERDLNILSKSRSSYVLGDFLLYHDFPDVTGLKPTLRSLPDFETLTPNNITSESNAINALIVSGILDDFLNGENTVETFNGRMGSGEFGFNVTRTSGEPVHIEVEGAQLEIDGGFENKDAVVILEAKNVVHNDFNVRQLYYPYRKYYDLVHKPIRLIFSQYTNLTYYLYEYEFTEIENYNSIKLLQTKVYSLENAHITATDLWELLKETPVTTTDNQNCTSIPFIQADRFDRVISLMERLQSATDNTMTTDEVTQFMGTVQRQAAYYPAAGEYLGLFDRQKRGTITLSENGKRVLQKGRRERQLTFAQLMFRHKIFHELFSMVLKIGRLPNSETVESLMLNLNVCNGGQTVHRRAQTVIGWLRWLMNLIDESAQ